MQRLAAALATALCLLAVPLAAQEPGHVAVQTDTLDNGLTLILSPDHSAQVVAVDLWYNVGSRNEVRGRTGFAHLFEHMMFQGSEHVKKAEHFQLVQRAGGNMNGSTAEDRTNYFEVLPSNRLNLGLWLEADRMRSLAVTDSNFHNQREAVKEERRLRVDNQPYTRALFEDAYAIYDSSTCFPYAHSVIGSMTDLDAAETQDVRTFHDLYYAPNNATLTIVGDFDPAQAQQLVRQYFGGIPRSQKPPPVECAPKLNTGQIRRHETDAKATLPGVFHVYRVPAYESPDYPALELLSTILGQGQSSRLNVRLARDAKAAVATQVLLNPFGPRRGPGLFFAFAIANQGVAIDSVDGLLTAEIARVGREGVTDEELAKAKNQYRSSTINDRQQALNVAESIQTANMFLGDPNDINSDLARYMKVTAADVKRVAATYLQPDNSLVLIVTPEATP